MSKLVRFHSPSHISTGYGIQRPNHALGSLIQILFLSSLEQVRRGGWRRTQSEPQIGRKLRPSKGIAYRAHCVTIRHESLQGVNSYDDQHKRLDCESHTSK